MEHWIIRVGDGQIFRNSKHSIWKFKKDNGSIERIVKNIKRGDILWFLTSKKYDNILIGMAKFIDYNGSKKQDQEIKIKYTNLYDIEKQAIKINIQGNIMIVNYKKIKDLISEDLIKHYTNFIYYAKESDRFHDYSYYKKAYNIAYLI